MCYFKFLGRDAGAVRAHGRFWRDGLAVGSRQKWAGLSHHPLPRAGLCFAETGLPRPRWFAVTEEGRQAMIQSHGFPHLSCRVGHPGARALTGIGAIAQPLQRRSQPVDCACNER